MREDRSARRSGLVRFGSLAVTLRADDPFWEGALLRRFRARVEPDGGPRSAAGATPLATAALTLDIRRDPAARPAPATAESAGPIEDDILRMEHGEGRVFLLSEMMTLALDRSVQPGRAEITVHAPEPANEELLEHCFAIYVHKLLQLLGIVRLHGGAVEIDGAAHVFLGDKGAGKSTIALALGRAGGLVLADDQIAIRRTGGGGMFVSGCDGRIRLTEQSERYFLDTPLAAEPQDFAGVPKKEVALADLVHALPYEDRAARCLYFPVVGHRFGVRPIPPREAAVRILGAIVPAHRFVDPGDRLDLVRLVTDFVEPLRCADLELSPDLGEIARLVEHVGLRTAAG